MAETVMLGCGTPRPQEGGAGAEAGNAITVEAISKEGRPVAGARVEVRPAGSDTLEPTQVGVTGPDGKARLAVAVDRNWSVLVRSEGNAYWKVSEAGQPVVDTLRPVARLSGLLTGCKRTRISVPGMGIRTLCGENGYFQLDSLPSGSIPVRFTDSVPDTSPQEMPPIAPAARLMAAGWKSRDITVQIQPGRDASLILAANWGESGARAIPADTLAVWGGQSMPVGLPRGVWGDTGAFSVAIWVVRTGTAENLRLISWPAADSNGLSLSLNGGDSLILEVGGQRFVKEQVYLDLNRGNLLSLEYDGRLVKIGIDSRVFLEVEAPGLAKRAGWQAPQLGMPEVCRVAWATSLRGIPDDTWLRTIQKGGMGESSSVVADFGSGWSSFAESGAVR